MAIVSKTDSGGQIASRNDSGGNIISYDNDSKLSYSSLNRASASSYLNYGSYSGSDIKVIVHFPTDKRTEKKIEADINKLKQAISEEGKRLDQNRLPNHSNNGDVSKGLLERLSDLEEQYKEAISHPSSKVIGELQTLSYSIYREKNPVRTLGSVYPRTYLRGPRCLPASENVYIKDKGYISIADVKTGDFVQSSGYTFDKVLGSFNQGIKKCYSLKLRNGYSLKASYDHPIYTSKGWVNMEDLRVNDKVYVSGSTPTHEKDYEISDSLLKMIAYLIGDGSTRIYNYEGKITTRISLSISDIEMDTIGKDVLYCLNDLNVNFNDNRKNNDKCIARTINVCKPNKGLTDWRLREYNSLHEALVKYDLYNTYSHTKKIPQDFSFGLSTKQIVLFLRHLFSTDGGYSISKDKKYIQFNYSSTSEKLIDQIRLLLNKLGINTIKNKENKIGKVGGRPSIISRHDCYSIIISDALELVRFFKRVGVFGKDSKLDPYISLLKSRIKHHELDISSKDFCELVKETAKKQGIGMKQFSKNYNIYNYQKKVTPRRALKIAKILNDNNFYNKINTLIDNLIDKRYDFITKPVVSIEDIGNLKVYDLEVENRHSFIANFIKVHNTIGGTMIFTVFHKHVFHEILDLNLGPYNTGTSDHDRYKNSTNLPDQMPPLDISIIFANEYGALSHMGLWGVDIFQEGSTFSIEDIFSENTIQYVARDLDPIRVVGTRSIDGQGVTNEWTNTASGLLVEKSTLKDYLKRRDPFI